MAREANPSLYIIVRTRYVQELALMLNLGADDVIPDEFGTSIEIFSHVLNQYHIPRDEIEKFIEEIRADGYEKLRHQHTLPNRLSDVKLNMANAELNSFRLHPTSPLVGKSLSESELRKKHGMTVLLIRRETQVLSNPGPDTLLAANDIVLVLGEKGGILKAKHLFHPIPS
jgi:CPA2 family monovalent cation:H+ antiporter-2